MGKAELSRLGKRKVDKVSGVQGILIIDKPTGLTSHDVVQEIRRAFKVRQVGHAGTLDPIASGVLVLLVGSATRIAQYLQEDDKEYHLTLRLGLETDTQDITGREIKNTDACHLSPEAVEKAVEKYRGTFSQTPPRYSAVKKAGKPLYKLARQGVAIQADPRNVTIYSAEVNEIRLPRVSMEVVCSKGTYMRTLCHDIGMDLGVGGCMESLVRVRSGSFTLADAADLEQVMEDPSPERWLKPATEGLGFPAVELTDEDLMRLVSGTMVGCGIKSGSAAELISVSRKGRLIALAQPQERDGKVMLSPRRVLEPNLKELFKQMDK